MSGPTDIQDDYIHLDNLQTVTVTHKVRTGDLVDAGKRAVKMDASKLRAAFGNIQLQGTEVGWILFPREFVNVTEVNAGDTITHSSGTYTIKNVAHAKWDTQLVCLTVKQR